MNWWICFRWIGLVSCMYSFPPYSRYYIDELSRWLFVLWAQTYEGTCDRGKWSKRHEGLIFRARREDLESIQMKQREISFLTYATCKLKALVGWFYPLMRSRLCTDRSGNRRFAKLKFIHLWLSIATFFIIVSLPDDAAVAVCCSIERLIFALNP